MAYTPVPVESFGGLNVESDPADVGWTGAIDMLDVEIDRKGLLRSRDFFSSLVANTSLTSPTIVGAGSDYWIASTAASVKLYSGGSLLGTAVAPAQYFNGMVVPFGTPTTSYIYLADNSGVNSIRRLTTAGVISAPTSMPTAQYLTRTSTDNRLVAAFTGAGGPGVWNPHRVQFSNAGNAEAWGEAAKSVTGVAATGVFTSVAHGYNINDAVYFVVTAGGSGITSTLLYYVNTVPSADTFTVSLTKGGSTFTYSTNLTSGTVSRNNDYVDLDPGDNEQIHGAATFGNSTYIFKSTKIFEFYGNSIDGSGNPSFNYRAFRNGVGAVTLAIAGSDGVYFSSYSGPYLSVFRINQSGITEVGRPIRRLLSSLAPSTFTAGSLTQSDVAFAGGRFRMLVTNGTASYCFSYDPVIDTWTLMRIADSATALTGYGDGNKNLIVATTGASASVHKLDATNTSSDSLRTPTPLYRSGFSDLGTTQRKRVREWILEGSGTPTLKTSVDFGALETGAAVTLGTSPAVAESRRRYATRGRQFSWQVSASGAFSINNLVAHVDEKRAPGTHA